jgi:arylsulfatase A
MRRYFWCFILFAIFIAGCDSNEHVFIKPNILLMIADDMGYSDLASYGGPSGTPHLDKLSASGIRFTDFYAAAPNCSPSRTGLMTGRSPAIVGMYNYRPPNHPMHLREEEVTIAEVLLEQNYQTAHIGKWHLGCLPQDSLLNHPQPMDQGFHYSFGTENNAQPSHLNPVNFVRNGEELPEQKGYSCQILTDEVINWLENHKGTDQPFFMYVAFHEPHAKIASPPELVQKYAEYPQKDAEYLANIENLDSAAGRILNYLEDKQLIENTLIIFSSDNGSYRQASNGRLRAVKSYVYEGGIRVPGIIHWPGFKQQGKGIHEPAGFVDILPTICDVLDIDPPAGRQLDGTSILPLLNGQEFERTQPLYWFFYRTSPEIAVRMDDMMILGKDNDTIPRTHRFSAPDMTYIKTMDLVDYELYNLADDPGQYQNLIDTHPDADRYIQIINEKLIEIQSNGYEWEQLPEASGNKRMKTDWVRYSR